ncbi:MAG: LysR family transcriptional regulator [Oceanospirillaceae bacterium]|jgi:putative choline sulfate-utilization transcription factor|nr:LysR family transcriptional regulator [Oceanospirillaceae bacterium]MBT6077497.1 LysR family transcriptional regulator [Oceanospirillaceae bacterium]MBT7329910.1 LysR family transcriptional regulator [Oceanospirillaceae bacterium]
MLLTSSSPSAQSLLIFEAAARHLNFTAAAREIGSTQSSVSQQMRGLERKLELQLFKRVYRGVALTEPGKQLYDAVESGFQQMANCLEALQKTRTRLYINVATDFAFAAFWLLPRLPQFRELHPGIEVRIVSSQDQIDHTMPDTDISIVFAKGKPNNLHAHLLCTGDVFPICSPALLKQYGPVESHKKLASLPLLKLGDYTNQGWLDWRGFFNQRRSLVKPSEPVLSFNNYTLLVQAAIAGQGVGLGWGNLVDDLVDSGVLRALRSFSLNSEWGYYLVEVNAKHVLPAKQHFVDWLLTQ